MSFSGLTHVCVWNVLLPVIHLLVNFKTKKIFTVEMACIYCKKLNFPQNGCFHIKIQIFMLFRFGFRRLFLLLKVLFRCGGKCCRFFDGCSYGFNSSFGPYDSAVLFVRKIMVVF